MFLEKENTPEDYFQDAVQGEAAEDVEVMISEPELQSNGLSPTPIFFFPLTASFLCFFAST